MGPFFYEIFCLLPFMVCLVWSVILGLELKDGRRPVQVLWYFAIACTLLYFCHSLHFSRIVPAEPRWSQSLYLACNLAVYPLFYLYIRSLTNAGVQKRLLPLLLPLPLLMPTHGSAPAELPPPASSAPSAAPRSPRLRRAGPAPAAL